MRGPPALAALLVALCLIRCDSPTSPGDALEFSFDFANGPQEWQAGFVDYPVGQDAFYELVADYRPLPASLAPDRSALYISGNNHSDDLFMFHVRRVPGLDPVMPYVASFEVEIATDVPGGCGGVGGSPGESVWVKAGASDAEPIAADDGSGMVRLVNFDHGNQANGGHNAIVLGNIANSQPCQVWDGAIVRRWELKVLRSPAPVAVRADFGGAVWLLVGTDSGFEATTSLYYTRVVATLEPE